MSGLHKSHGFQRSKVMLGALGPIHRARVSELWSDDPERACSPAQRAAEAAERIVFNPIVLDFFDDSYQAQYVCFDSFFRYSKEGPLVARKF